MCHCLSGSGDPSTECNRPDSPFRCKPIIFTGVTPDLHQSKMEKAGDQYFTCGDTKTIPDKEELVSIPILVVGVFELLGGVWVNVVWIKQIL